MKDLIAGFSRQLRAAVEIAEAGNICPNQDVNITNIIVCGLGGSGIGGTIVSSLLRNSLPVPIFLHKDYGLPAFVGSNTLVICCSYSGNTKETLSSFKEAIQRQAPIFVITSGGQILQEALKHNVPHITIPSGMPPRSCLGYSLVQVLAIIGKFYPNSSLIHQVRAAADLLDQYETDIQSEARKYSEIIVKYLPIIYSESKMEGVAIRWRQQFNENSKILCWHHTIPELNHNELVGWAKPHEDKMVLFLRSDFEYSKSAYGIELVDEIIRKYTDQVYHIKPKGSNLLEQSIYLIHLGDWISYFLAELRQVNPEEVAVIDHLKSKLEQYN